ncbi:MAG: class I SAM-dependent methyltransferase [Candidatus Kapaibacteriota bacterium]
MFEKVYNTNFELEDKYWWFVARNKIVFELTKRLTNISNGDFVLDFGCGTGGFASLLAKNYNVIGLDPSPIAIEYCKKRGLQNIFQSTLDDFTKPEYPLKAIFALDVIEHIDNDLNTLQKLYNLLAKDGYLIVTVPAYQWLWSNHDILHMHKRRYNKKTLSNALKQANFKVSFISYFNFFLFLPALVTRIFERKQSIENTPPVAPVSDFMNKILKQIFLIEKYFLPFVSFPFGLSLIAIAKKS